MNVLIEKFGKDHWSTFAYIETRCVDFKGVLDRRHMRCNPSTHPGLAHMSTWDEAHGTRLKGYFQDKNNPDLILPQHDDWGCVDDLEAAGLLESNGTGIHPVFVLTDLGHEIAAKLRKHKGQGGSFAGFEYGDEPTVSCYDCDGEYPRDQVTKSMGQRYYCAACLPGD